MHGANLTHGADAASGQADWLLGLGGVYHILDDRSSTTQVDVTGITLAAAASAAPVAGGQYELTSHGNLAGCGSTSPAQPIRTARIGGEKN
jgi:hypothetical protein